MQQVTTIKKVRFIANDGKLTIEAPQGMTSARLSRIMALNQIELELLKLASVETYVEETDEYKIESANVDAFNAFRARIYSSDGSLPILKKIVESGLLPEGINVTLKD